MRKSKAKVLSLLLSVIIVFLIVCPSVCAAADAEKVSEAQSLVDTAQHSAGFAKVDAYLAAAGFVEMNGVTDASVLSSLAALGEEVSAIRKAAKTATENEIALAEYEGKIKVGPYDFATKDSKSFKPAGGATFVLDEARGCETVRAAAGIGDHYISTSMANAAQDSVYEIDVTSFDTFPTNLYFETKASFTDGSGTTWVGLGRIKSGSLYTYKGSTLIKANIIHLGAFTHLAFAYHVATATIDVYVNDEFITTTSIRGAKDFTFTEVRVGSADGTASSYSVDNVLSYVGTAPRTLDRMERISDEEYFLLAEKILTEYSNGTSTRVADDIRRALWIGADVLPRIYDFSSSSLFAGEYEDGAALLASVGRYLALDVSDIRYSLSTHVLSLADERLAALLAIVRGIDTIDARLKAATDLEKFVASSKEDIPVGSEAYLRYTAAIRQAREDVAEDEEVKAAFALMDKFDSAVSDPHRRLLADRIEKYGISSFPSFASARVADYQTKLRSFERRENLMIFRAVADKFAAYETVASALDNYGTLSEAFKRAYFIDRDGEIDTADSAYLPAKTVFDTFCPAFYDRWQDETAERLGALAGQYRTTDSYMEKLGVIRAMRQIFEEESPDTSRPTLCDLADTLAGFEAEEPDLLSEYERFLDENTAALIDAMDRIEQATTYAEFLSAYNASRGYDHFLNIASVEARQAYERYEHATERKAQVEAAAKDFAVKVELIRFASGADEVYAAICAASAAQQAVFADCPGVPAAAEKLADYVAQYESDRLLTDASLRVTYAVVGTLRANFTPALPALSVFGASSMN